MTMPVSPTKQKIRTNKKELQIHQRIFSGSKAFTSEAENCQDGIIIPSSFLDILDTKISLKLRKLEIILVKVSSINNHFNREVNKMFKTQRVDLVDKLKEEAPEKTIYCHIKHFESLDDDSITLPQWMFDELYCKVGDPLTLSLDL